MDNVDRQRLASLWFPKGHLDINQRDFLIDLFSIFKPRYCIEVGFASGRSTVTTLIAANPEKLISVDANLDYIEGARDLAARLQSEFVALKIYEGKSVEVLKSTFLSTEFPMGIDYAFIDGGHTYNDCYGDIVSILPHLNHNGIVLVDDYYSGPPAGWKAEGVDRAVHDIASVYGLMLDSWHRLGKGFAILRRRQASL